MSADVVLDAQATTAITRLDAARAAAALSAAGSVARGFLGLDPVTQNLALLTRQIRQRNVHVFESQGMLVGWQPKAAQPRQAHIATTTADAELLQAFLTFLVTYQRCSSFVAEIGPDGTARPALLACGFARVGTLAQHRFQGGEFVDVDVYWRSAAGVGPCPS